jgi:hypothetical protein
MRDYGTIDRLPRVDINIGHRTIQTARSKINKLLHDGLGLQNKQ